MHEWLYPALSLSALVVTFAMLGCVADLCREREMFEKGI